MSYYLAEFNIARFKEGLATNTVAEFAESMNHINRISDNFPGFIWRMESDIHCQLGMHLYNDNKIIVNMSVWESYDALKDFTYHSNHAEKFKLKRNWFDGKCSPSYVMWWLKVGHYPSAVEGKNRLDSLKENGPTPRAFNFRTFFNSHQI